MQNQDNPENFDRTERSLAPDVAADRKLTHF